MRGLDDDVACVLVDRTRSGPDVANPTCKLLSQRQGKQKTECAEATRYLSEMVVGELLIPVQSHD